jgi:hypothetical protein
VQVTFQQTADDYRHGLLVGRDLRPWARWAIRFLAAFMALVFLISMFQSVNGGFAGAIPGFVLSIAFLVWMWVGPSLSAGRQFRNTPAAHDPMTIDATDAGLEIHSVHTDSKVAWSAYMAWGEDKTVFAILPQPRIYVPIPKRAFTAEQLSEFRELLRRNIKPR